MTCLHSSRGGHRLTARVAALCLFAAAALLLPGLAHAQWTQPDANNNINNTNTGNVGVGTTSPQSTLHVSTASTAGRGITSEQTSNDGSPAIFSFSKSRAGAAVMNGDSIGSLYAVASDGTTFLSPTRMRFSVDGPVTTGSVPTSIQFFTGSSGAGAERLRISSEGNVGVGTAAPQSSLHVSTSSIATGARGLINEQTSNDSNGALLIVRKSRAGAAVQNGDSVGNIYAQAFDGATFVSGSRLRFIVDGPVATNSVPTAIQFLTGVNNTGVERMRITSGGSVGIGTGAPASLMHLFGTGTYGAGLVIDGQGATANQQSHIDFMTLGDGTKGTFNAATKGWHFTARGNSYTTVAERNDMGLFYWNGASFLAGAYWDSATGNMGVGNMSPTQKLDVTGSVNASGLCLGGDCKTAWSQVSSQWTTSGSNVYFNTGNVGVGTTTPVSPLEVSKSQAAVTVFQVTNATASAGNGAAVRMFTSGNNALTLSAQENAGAGGYASINQEANLPLLVKTNNAERMRITGAGNVGIGNTNPGSQLFVGGGTAAVATLPGLNVALGGNSYVSASNGTINTFFGSDTSTYGIVGTLSNHPLGLRANNALAVTVMPTGNVGVGTAAPAHKLDVAGNANASGLCIAGECKTAWSQVGGTSQWTTSGTSINYNTGNVGVGTDTPNQRLSVLGTGAFYNSAPVQPSGVRGLFMGNFSVGSSIWSYNYVAGAGDPLQVSAQDITLNTYVGGNGVTRLHVNNTGNIGVGTNAPASLLNLVGANAALTFGTAGASDASAFSVAVTASGTNTNSGHGRGLTVKAGDSDNAAGKVGGSLTLNPGAPVAPATAHGNVLLATAGGSVGVGTASPAERLDVRGNLILDAGTNPNLYTGTAAAELNRYLNVLNSPGHSSASGLKAGGVLVADDYGYANPAKNDLVVKGRVGVGTAAPAHKLDVAGNANASGLCIAGECKTAWSQVGGTSQWTTSGTSINYNTGSVGIGTTTPQAKLSVVGGANTALLVGDRGMSGSVGLQFLGSGYRHAGVRFDGDNVVVESASISHVPSTWHGGGQALNFVVRNGNVGINKTNPTEALDVVGNITATGNIAAKYQDVAEWVPSTQRLAAGTVVVLDRGRNNHVLASTSSYDTGVAGVVSAQPGVILGEGGADKLMVATTGRVRIKVDATHAPILIGDLLVTSDVAGVAMKSEPVAFGTRKMHAPGTIIGKALEPLASGKGEILVLLSLQ